jgi:hypothetical protein
MPHFWPIATLISIAMLLQPAPSSPAPSADELAAAVMKASGADNWSKVTRVKFTFVAGKGSRSHDWDVKNHTDTVTVNGKTMTAKLNAPNSDEDAKKAFGAWTNDSYWLMAPMKVMDRGVKRSVQADETIDGKTYHVLHLSFEKVGMTPSDQYNLFVDPETNLVRHWDYIPAKGEPRRFTWDEYKDFNGIKLATEHKINGSPAITFTGIEVMTE